MSITLWHWVLVYIPTAPWNLYVITDCQHFSFHDFLCWVYHCALFTVYLHSYPLKWTTSYALDCFFILDTMLGPGLCALNTPIYYLAGLEHILLVINGQSSNRDKGVARTLQAAIQKRWWTLWWYLLVWLINSSLFVGSDHWKRTAEGCIGCVTVWQNIDSTCIPLSRLSVVNKYMDTFLPRPVDNKGSLSISFAPNQKAYGSILPYLHEPFM